ncbi:MAG: hypothetical protein ABFS32_00115 [Bacteroidota bacterium]
MKRAILMMMATVAFLTSCTEDPTPPSAGFTLSSDFAVQWDMVTVTESATGAESTSYTVSGGAYEMDDATLTIQFLDAATYTVTQTATNADGTDEVSVDIVVTAPDNTYTLEGTDYTIGTSTNPNAFWYDASAMGGTIYIRMLGDVSGQDNPNLIKLYSVAGPNPIEATYTWSDSGDIGTYDAGMTANYAGMAYDWTSNGTDGGDLVIELVYEDTADATNNVYDITLALYTLNAGSWNFAVSPPTWTTIGDKTLAVSYRGKIDPVN